MEGYFVNITMYYRHITVYYRFIYGKLPSLTVKLPSIMAMATAIAMAMGHDKAWACREGPTSTKIYFLLKNIVLVLFR